MKLKARAEKACGLTRTELSIEVQFPKIPRSLSPAPPGLMATTLIFIQPFVGHDGRRRLVVLIVGLVVLVLVLAFLVV